MLQKHFNIAIHHWRPIWRSIKEMTDNAHVTHQYITRPPKKHSICLYFFLTLPSFTYIEHLFSFNAIQKTIRRAKKIFYFGLEFCLLLKFFLCRKFIFACYRVADSVEHLRRQKGLKKKTFLIYDIYTLEENNKWEFLWLSFKLL